MIEEEQEIRKTNYVKIFLKADKRKNKKKGFKKTQVTKTNKGNIIPKKNFQKRKLAKKGEFSDKKADKRFFHVFLKKGNRQRKTQKENKREKKGWKTRSKKHKRQKIETKLLFFFEKKFAKSFFLRQQYPPRTRKQRKKGGTWKTHGNIEKSRKIKK